MAKKLNKKVALIGIVLLVLALAAGSGLVAFYFIRKNPDRALKLHHKAMEAGDYIEAEQRLGQAYGYGKTDEYKVERLFDLAKFHLIQNDQHDAEWRKAMGCWSKIVTIDPSNIEARQALLDYYYQAADAGSPQVWRNVEENAAELIDALRSQGREPDTDLLTAHAKALLSIARRGETTTQREVLGQSIALLTRLNETNPQNAEFYQLLAEARTVEGELDMLDGALNATENAQAAALELLESSVELSEDTSTAVANLMLYKLQTFPANDPNAIPVIRTELEERLKQVTPNDKLWEVVSIAYEVQGDTEAEAAINRAIEAIRHARELDPENFEYVFRMSRLLNRKGNIFNDAAAKADALQIAEDALSMEAVQETAGPLQGRNYAYRFNLNTYLADFYLQEALAAKGAGDTDQVQRYVQKAKPLVEAITNTIGTTDNPTVYKFRGLLALAEDQQEKGVRLLYKAYEQNKALDKPDEASHVDSVVCLVLAREAKREGLIGLQQELLAGALSARDRYVLQQPDIYLDYAEVLNTLRNARGWATAVEQFVNRHQRQYGTNEQCEKLLVEAAIGSQQFDKAEQYLASFKGTAEDKLRYELNITIVKIAVLTQTLENLKAENQEPTAEQTQELQTLRQQRDALMPKVLSSNAEAVDTRLLVSACRDLMQNGEAEKAAGYLDICLEQQPDSLSLLTLRLQARQEDPMNLTGEQQAALRKEAIDLVQDPKEKALLQSEEYRREKDFDKAVEVLEQSPDIDAQTDPDIVNARFALALEKEDLETAESLFQTIRSENMDRCEGNFASARLETVKENYDLALRRLDECLSLRPFLSDGYLLKSQVYARQGEEESAIENAKTAIRMSPRSPLYARNLAILLFARNAELENKKTIQQEVEAQQAILMASQLNPGDTQLQSLFAESIQDRDPDRALAIRQQILESNPTAANAMMLGNMAIRMARAEWDAAKKTGLIKRAGSAYEKALELEPDNELARQAYADHLQATQQGEKALGVLEDDKNLVWKFYLRGGQYAQAETILKELLQEKPEDVLLIQGLVTTSQGAGKRDQVKDYLAMLAGLDVEKEIELWIIQKYIDVGFAEEAEKHLVSFNERYPGDDQAMLLEAWTRMGKGQLDEALALTNRYLETDTSNPGAWRLRGRLYRLMNQPRKAVEDLQHSKSLRDEPEVRRELASVYISLNQETAAIGELVPSLKDPQVPMQNRLMLEGLYKRFSKTSELDKLYAEMIERYPESPYWYLRAGVFYLGQGQLPKALGLLEKAMDLNPQGDQSSSLPLNYYLEALYQMQQYDKVITVASRYIDTPLAHIAYGFMGQVHVQLKRTQQAKDSYYKALEKAGTNQQVLGSVMRLMLESVGEPAVTAWIDRQLADDSTALAGHLLAYQLAESKELYNQAIDHIEKSLEIVAEDDPKRLGYEFVKVNLLVKAYVKTSDQQYLGRAIDFGGQLLEKQPGNASLLNNMAYLLADNNQQLEKALEYSRRAHQSDPGNVVYLDTYAYAQCKNGHYEKAQENLLWAMQIYEAAGQPVPWDLYEHLAIAYEELKDYPQAVETYQKALEAAAQAPEKEQQQLQDSISRLQNLL